MRRIKLSKLILRNFKGVKDMEVTFTDSTNIKGDNGTGKTSVFDAFTWLLFDKDSTDRQSFEIKTLNESNQVLHGLEHQVTGILNVDGKDIKLGKVFKEKWTKKKGESSKKLTGHETLCYVNDIPVKQSEYKDTIAKLIDEQLFKLISNPLYFGTNMKWQDRRDVIMEIIGEVPVERVIRMSSKLSSLAPLLADMDIDTLKRSIAVKKKKINEDIKAIPYRIDELNNSIQLYDFNAIEFEISQNEAYIQAVEEKLLKSSKSNEPFIRLYDLKNKLRQMDYDLNVERDKQLREFENKAKDLDYQVNRIKRTIEDEAVRRDNLSNTIKGIESMNEQLKARWYEKSNEDLVFNEEQFVCPTCHRAFEVEDIESKKQQMRDNFNNGKKNNLRKITEEGVCNKKKLEDYEKQLHQLELRLASLKETLRNEERKRSEAVEALNNFVPSITVVNKDEYEEVKEQIAALEASLPRLEEEGEDIDSLKVKKSELYKSLDEYKKKLNAQEENERIKRRIDDLMEEERVLAKQLADLESTEILCEEYTKSKVELLESSINSKFNLVKFKLFNTLVNGAIEDCCEALINGVPFSNANKAAQINGGLDIINALCGHYGVEAPIFIDNRESVNDILPCDSQVINLFVSRDKPLKIENVESEALIEGCLIKEWGLWHID